ncbi:hypothetical protein I6N90_17065 [Paenibacillus sp. GSMTC-2017]|uniref:hypothetical protein n=1 Tax=Paenibacillus sp. GSMTC-2017 TaxID=2794350 RepID=UPI0018D95706|nr:hypothetical protein [Paenibacillus sp. GSMTC-2017]MBH5319509.1 hypothetical protein [Paenibacillus sp. GSMTC-2017]
MKTYVIKLAGYAIVIGCVLLVYVLLTQDRQVKTTSTTTAPAGLTDISDFQHKISDTTKRNVPQDPKMLQGYGLRLYDWNGKFVEAEPIIAKDDKVKMVVSMTNATDESDRVGFYLFVDGKLQPYQVDDAGDTMYVYSDKMPAKSVRNVPISFEAKDSSAPERTLFIVMIHKMNELPGDRTPHIDFFTLSLRKPIIFPEADKNVQTLFHFTKTKPIPDSFTGFYNAKKVSIALTPETEELTFSQQALISLPADQTSPFILRGAGLPGRYATVLFQNHQPVFLSENEPEIFWEIKEKEMLELPVTLQTGNSLEPIQLYSITIPLDGQLPVAVNSPKMKTTP